jgi:hypothetical protein
MPFRGATLIGDILSPTQTVRAGATASTDTRLRITAETPWPSTPRTARFGTQLPDPFDVRFTPGSHRLRLASIHVCDAYSFRSSLLTIFN